jgi:cell division protease FtsH
MTNTELGHRRVISEHTARLVDEEVKRLVDEAHNRARVVLEEHKELLETIAQALLERETLGREDLEFLQRGDPLPPLPEPEPESLPTVAATQSERPGVAAPPLGLPGSEGPLPGPAPGVYGEPADEEDA